MTDHTPSHDDVDPIVSVWASQSERGDGTMPSLDLDALLGDLAKAHRKDRRRLWWLTVREVLPSVVIAGLLGVEARGAEHPIAVVLAALLILGVAAYLATTTIRQHQNDRAWDLSLRHQLERRINQLRYGALLLRNVLWWYFLPFGAAILLGAYGLGADFGDPGDLLALGAVGVFLAIAYRMNRRLGRVRYEAEIERLEPVLAHFDQVA